ncbi:MATE family efflux transporter, partial [Escherichia coli]|nr:MATE family efflux transporter [Escherichia coli]
MSLVKIIPKHLWVAASSWGARGISACVQIVSVHYLVSLLGEDKYSAFILLGGLITWCNLSDFGIGNSILNYIAERRAQDKNYEYFILVGSVIVFILFFIVAVFLCFLSMTVAEQYLKIYSDAIINNKIILFYISTLIFCGTALAGIIYKIWYAEQIGWLSNLFPAVCALIGLLNIIVVRKIDGNFSDLLIVFVLFYLPALIIPIYLLLKRYRFEIRKTKLNRRLFAGASLKIIERARPFFIFAVMGAIVLQTDLIVLSQKGDASEIILYGVLLKIFNVIYFIYSAVLQAWWPVCTELRIKKQWVELKKSIRLS